MMKRRTANEDEDSTAFANEMTKKLDRLPAKTRNLRTQKTTTTILSKAHRQFRPKKRSSAEQNSTGDGIQSSSRGTGSELEVVHEFDQKLFVNAKLQENELTLSLWDFGGQIVFYSMHHVFMTSTGVYLLVFDMRELCIPDSIDSAMEYIQFWLQSIKLHAPSAPLFLVGTFMLDVNERKKLQEINETLLQLPTELFSQVLPNEKEGFSLSSN